MVTATYSNGHTDEYKGRRAVGAGWSIFNKETGACVAGGHSLTLTLAAKNGNARMQVHQIPTGYMVKWYDKEDLVRFKVENAEFKSCHLLEVVAC